MAESLVSGVAVRLGNSLIQEANFLCGVRTQVELLQTELKQLQGLLKDADARQDESEAVRQWVADARELAYDAEDVIATYALKVGSRKGGSIQKVVKRCAYILSEGITAYNVGAEIENIKMKITNLKMNFRDYGIKESIIQGDGSSSSNEREREHRQTFSHLEHDVVGFDDDLNKLVEFLLRDREGNRVASICGMGGLGKTTLAKMVYNYPEVKKHFDCRTWSYITQQCQRRRVWEEILIKVNEKEREGIQKLEDEDIIKKLREILCEKKCLVILDDICDIETWNILREAFPMKNTSSKILLTSCNKEVSLHVDTEVFLCELQCLNMARSWELLEKIVISRRKDCVTNVNKPNIEKLGKEMIEYCGGLPLAITVLGGLLAAKQTQDEWEDVLQHIKSYILKEDDLRVNKVLGLSYNDLPCHLKPCFLYLGHFSEDFEIPTEELIQMWIGEGFIWLGEDGEDTMEYKGERYLRELMQRSMVQVGEISRLGRIETCQIHDLMREFCISKAQQENFLHSTEGSQGRIGKIRRLAITLESNDNYLNEYPYLRSLLCFMPSKEFYFKKSKLLRVLNLNSYQRENLTKDIGRFIHLRFLSLKNSNINKVPSFLGNLRCLHTLDLRIRDSPVWHLIVPNIFKEMKQLRHLYLPRVYKVSEKLALGNLCNLQTLLNVGPETIKMPTSFRFNYLRTLDIKIQVYDEGPHLIQMLVSGCPHLYQLVVFYPIKKLTETHQFSPNLAELELTFTKLEEDPMPTLEKLSNLKILHLCYESFVGKDMVCSEGGFPLLQYLLLDYLDKLEEWRVEEGAMPSLCHLIISYCGKLKTIPDGLRFVTTLQELEINFMPKSFKDRLDKGGPDFYKVQHVPSLVFQHSDKER
nr:putative disease resistance protein At1g50180 [Quercus suber]